MATGVDLPVSRETQPLGKKGGLEEQKEKKKQAEEIRKWKEKDESYGRPAVTADL